ncbi:MAG: sulfotransferase [Anaerolineae bacterium]|nr:sulfotransferase [Anaerolineae bacterium]
MTTEHFFVVGAQRSATTYLYHLLHEHPQIEMAKPIRPEPKFFLLDDLYAQGIDAYLEQFFDPAVSPDLRGEKSTSYCESEKAARRIADHFPQARIIFLLREPVERAVSNYWFSVRNGLETRPIGEAFREEDSRRGDYQTSVSPFAYVKRGLYIEQIEMYEQFFPREQIGIFLHERLIASPEALDSIYRFLGVGSSFNPPSWGQVINAGQKGSETLTPDLEQMLIGKFAKPNARLAERMGIDLTEWERTG